MALQAVLASLDAIPEALRTEYKRGDDGRFYLDVHGVDDMPAVAGLKRKNTELMDEVKDLKRTQQRYGMTPEELEELKKRADAGGGKSAEELRKEYEQKLASTSEQAQKEVKKAQEDAAAAARAAEDYFLDSEITRALGEVKGEPALLSHVMRERVQVKRTEQGKFNVVVVDGNGVARIKDSQGNPFSLVDYAQELRGDPRFGRAFEPSGNSGSGAQGASGGAAGGGAAGSMSRSDPLAWGANAEKIAKGEITLS